MPNATAADTVYPISISSSEVAILFVDALEQFVSGSRTNPPEVIRRSASVLLQGAHELDIPAIAVGVSSKPGEAPEMMVEIQALKAFTRTMVSAADDPAVAAYLHSNGKRLIALAGLSTEIAVLRTALSARKAGFQVHVLLDACGALDARAEQAAIRQMEIAGVVLSSVSIFLSSLVFDMAKPDGRAVFGVLSKLWM